MVKTRKVRAQKLPEDQFPPATSIFLKHISSHFDTYVRRAGTIPTNYQEPPIDFSTAIAFHPESRRIFVFGGSLENKSQTNQLWSFNSDTRVWCLENPSGHLIPPPRSGASMLCANGNLYLFGGYVAQKTKDIAPIPSSSNAPSAPSAPSSGLTSWLFSSQTASKPSKGLKSPRAKRKKLSSIEEIPSAPESDGDSENYREIDYAPTAWTPGPLSDIWIFDIKKSTWKPFSLKFPQNSGSIQNKPFDELRLSRHSAHMSLIGDTLYIWGGFKSQYSATPLENLAAKIVLKEDDLEGTVFIFNPKETCPISWTVLEDFYDLGTTIACAVGLDSILIFGPTEKYQSRLQSSLSSTSKKKSSGFSSSGRPSYPSDGPFLAIHWNISSNELTHLPIKNCGVVGSHTLTSCVYHDETNTIFFYHENCIQFSLSLNDLHLRKLPGATRPPSNNSLFDFMASPAQIGSVRITFDPILDSYYSFTLGNIYRHSPMAPSILHTLTPWCDAALADLPNLHYRLDSIFFRQALFDSHQKFFSPSSLIPLQVVKNHSLSPNSLFVVDATFLDPSSALCVCQNSYVWRFDFLTMKISRIPNLELSGGFSMASLRNGSAYIYDNNVLYQISGNKASIISQNCPPAPRGAILLCHKNILYHVGGYRSDLSWSDSVYSFNGAEWSCLSQDSPYSSDLRSRINHCCFIDNILYGIFSDGRYLSLKIFKLPSPDAHSNTDTLEPPSCWKTILIAGSPPSFHGPCHIFPFRTNSYSSSTSSNTHFCIGLSTGPYFYLIRNLLEPLAVDPLKPKKVLPPLPEWCIGGASSLHDNPESTSQDHVYGDFTNPDHPFSSYPHVFDSIPCSNGEFRMVLSGGFERVSLNLFGTDSTV